jgi:pSer/pThr/pTyr-binding forkhead associated (FHA) protein
MRRLLGPSPGQVRDIDHELLIGRAPADVELADQEVSRRHAVVRPVPAGVEVEDLASRNGTYIDGHRIEGKVTLTGAATLQVGNSELTVEIDVPQATRISPTRTPQPGDATVVRPTARSQEPVARPPTPPPPAAPPPPPLTPPQPEPVSASGGGKRLLPFALGGLALAALVIVGLVLLLGGSSKKTPTATSTQAATSSPASTSTSTSAPSGGAGALALAVDTGGSLKFTTSSLSAKAGKVTIRFTNKSPVSHNLTIQHGTSGSVVGATPTFQGATQTLAVQLKSGTYTFFCSIPGHREAGMHGTLTVS